MTPEEREWVLRLHTALATLMTVCLSKGILTQQELEKARAIVTSELDQEMAADRERTLKENPGLDLLIRLMGEQP